MERKYGRDALNTPANLVTLGHLLLGGLLIYDIVKSDRLKWRHLALHALLSGSDAVDGKVARDNGTTILGERLDPIVDKVHAVGTLAALAYKGRIPWSHVRIIAARETAVTLYRHDVYNNGDSLPAKKLGKAKTFAQFTAIGVALTPFVEKDSISMRRSLSAATLLTLVSGVDIVRRGERKKRKASISRR